MSYRIELRTGGAENVSLATEVSGGGSYQYTTTVAGSMPLSTDRLITAYSNSSVDSIAVNSSAASASNPRTGVVSYQGLATGSRYLWLGLDPGGGSGLVGEVGEILFYGSALSLVERSTLESYINAKWQIF